MTHLNCSNKMNSDILDKKYIIMKSQIKLFKNNIKIYIHTIIVSDLWNIVKLGFARDECVL